jgi:integrase
LVTKRHIIDLHITPYFRHKKVIDITAMDIKNWQNEIKKKGFSDTYLKTIQAQMSAIMNFAVKFYQLGNNPCKTTGGMGKNTSGCKGIWQPSDMDAFLEQVKDKPIIYYSFFLIYWTGIRVGELLALTFDDIDFENKTLKISKSLNRVGSTDVITEPKTAKSNRTISLPEFVVDAMIDYVKLLYCRMPEDRLFLVTKSYLEKEIVRGAKLAGLPVIRIHDLRHSHASLLISRGVDIATVSNRLGHEKVTTTLNTYSHMFNDKAKVVADMLDDLYCSEEN